MSLPANPSCQIGFNLIFDSQHWRQRKSKLHGDTWNNLAKYSSLLKLASVKICFPVAQSHFNWIYPWENKIPKIPVCICSAPFPDMAIILTDSEIWLPALLPFPHIMLSCFFKKCVKQNTFPRPFIRLSTTPRSTLRSYVDKAGWLHPPLLNSTLVNHQTMDSQFQMYPLRTCVLYLHMSMHSMRGISRI